MDDPVAEASNLVSGHASITSIAAMMFATVIFFVAWRSTSVQAARRLDEERRAERQRASDERHERARESAENTTRERSESRSPSPPRTSTEAPVDLHSDDVFALKVKFLSDVERTVSVSPHETIRNMKLRSFHNEIESGKNVRLIWQGRELPDSNVIGEIPLTSDSVVHCLVSEMRTELPRPLPLSEEDWGQAQLLTPLVTLLLGLSWYCRAYYRQFFDGFSTLTMVVLTIVYIAFVCRQIHSVLAHRIPVAVNS